MGRSIAPPARHLPTTTSTHNTARKAVKKHMARFVKKGSKGAVGSVSTPGPAKEPVEGIAEIDFGTPTTAPATRPKSKYPLIEGKGVKELVDKIVDLSERFDAINDPFKAAKQELIEIGFPQFFAKNNGRPEAPSSMVAWGDKGGARVTYKDKFTPGDRKALEALLPGDAAKWFRQHWTIKIDGGEIPPLVGAKLVPELNALMKRFGVAHAMEIKAAILPVPEFAAKRHVIFSPSTNEAINKIVPQQASVTTKGVK